MTNHGEMIAVAEVEMIEILIEDDIEVDHLEEQKTIDAINIEVEETEEVWTEIERGITDLVGDMIEKEGNMLKM